MEIGRINHIYYLVISLLLIIIFIVGGKKRKKILEFLNWNMDSKLYFYKAFFIVLGSIFMVLALLKPQRFLKNEIRIVNENNFYVLLDISKSMLAKDSLPNRLELSKRCLIYLTDKLEGDKIGLIPYSDDAFLQLPLSNDYSIIKNFINGIDTEFISGGGTELEAGLGLANNSFNLDHIKNKSVIIFSDGGDYDSELLDFVKRNKIKVYAFGVGSNSGAPIPKKDGGFITDDKGKIVITKRNSSFLEKLAKESGGAYYPIDRISDVDKFIRDVQFMKKENLTRLKSNYYKQYYHYPLVLALIFILIGYFLKRRRKEYV